MRVTVSDDPDVAPFFACEGFDATIGEPCARSGESLTACPWCGDDRLVAGTSLVFAGYTYELVAERRDGGRARLCRTYSNDVSDDACEPGYECAVSGEVVLTSGGGATVHAVFEGGRTIDAAVAPRAM